MNFISILKKKVNFFLREEYNIGFIDIDNQFLECDNLSICWLRHSYKKGWFADPFIVKLDNSYVEVLVEEFQYSSNKGCISKLVIERNTWELKEVNQIMDIDTHLSFPAIFRHDGDVFIYPENCNSGKLILYKYDTDTEEVRPISVWCNLPLTDAILLTCYRSPIIISTKRPDQNGSLLGVYEASGHNPENWNFSLKYNISFEDNVARNAGAPFYWKNKLIRPAQICNDGYGKGLSIQEFLFDNGKIHFKELKRYYPTSRKWNDGLHTLNAYKDLAVVDGRRRKHPMLLSIYQRIHKYILK